MNYDEPKFEKKFKKFSVIKECPMCKGLSLSYKNGLICCANCGYEEKVTTAR